MMKSETVNKQERRQVDLEIAPEVCVYMACYGLITEMIEVRADLAQHRITKRFHAWRFVNLVSQFCEIASLTWRFDLVLPVSDRGIPSPFFWRWYNWWEDYLKSLTPAQVQHMERLALDRAPELSRHRPPGAWVDHRADPAFIVN
jgi:hypothetical protein